MLALSQTCCSRPAATTALVGAPRRPGVPPPASRWHRLACAAAARPQAGSSSGAAAEEGAGREFASSVALLVLGASLISERINGCGIVQQLELDHPHIEPLLLGIAGALAVAAAWPAARRARTAADWVRQLAGRAAFGGLAAAVSAEVFAGKGLLALLELETGAEALSESEAALTALLLLVLTRPSKTAA